MTPVLLDNTVLTNFALVGRPDMVLRLWPDTACATPAVQSEYQVGAAAGLVPGETWADLPMVALTEAEATFAAELPPRLGAGERTCLVSSHTLLPTQPFFQVAQQKAGALIVAGIEF
jgi:hypothetical protein